MEVSKPFNGVIVASRNEAVVAHKSDTLALIIVASFSRALEDIVK